MHVLRFVFVLFALSWAHPALAEPGVCPDGRIDVNAASAPVLTRLKGVGAKTAAKIVADRAANGPFASVAAMQRVKGVGAKRVQQWADKAATDCAAASAPAPPADATPDRRGAKVLPGPAGAALDLNTATAEQLRALPGVGKKTAAAIIALRGQLGRFEDVEQLLGAKGVGKGRLAKIRPLVTVRP